MRNFIFIFIVTLWSSGLNSSQYQQTGSIVVNSENSVFNVSDDLLPMELELVEAVEFEEEQDADSLFLKHVQTLIQKSCYFSHYILKITQLTATKVFQVVWLGEHMNLPPPHF